MFTLGTYSLLALWEVCDPGLLITCACVFSTLDGFKNICVSLLFVGVSIR